MTKRNAIIAGASGLTGAALLEQLTQSESYKNIYTLDRRIIGKIGNNHHPMVVDFANMDGLPECDDAYCCLGTTIKTAGSKAAFRTVDFDYVVHFARAALAAGAKQFLVISALGANANSRVFYTRTKGEMEKAIGELGFITTHIFQPSFLVGARKRLRPGEQIGITLFKALSPFLIGAARKYRPIAVGDVARAMITTAVANEKSDIKGVRRYPSDQIAALAGD